MSCSAKSNSGDITTNQRLQDMEDKKRTLVKTAIYRGSTTVLLFALSWILTNSVYETSLITILFNVVATGIYYFHERFWSKVNWGVSQRTKNTSKIVDAA